MTNTQAVEYDIFISYAAVDNHEFPSETCNGWVSLFVQGLERVLASRMGGREKFKFYFDRRNLSGNHQLDELLNAAKSSSLFLSICSPAYVARDWTRKELSAFVGSMSDLSQLFCIEYLPLDDGEIYPAPLDTHKRFRFWERDDTDTAIAMPIRSRSDKIESRLHDLADQIKRQLVAMRSAAANRPRLEKAAAPVAEAAEQGKGVVYLAETTDDLDEERLQVRRYLSQYGYHVVPDAYLPGGGEVFKAAARESIAGADLYLQLLGPRAGRRPTDLPEGYGAAQFRVACEIGKTILAWRHPSLIIGSVSDQAHREFLADEHVVGCGLQEFMDQARRRLESIMKKPKSPPAAPALVFINAEKDDREIAHVAQQAFLARNLATVIPIFEGPPDDIRQDLTANLQECDVVVFIYGDAPLTWIRGQMRQYIKARCLKDPARALAIFIGPPDAKTNDIGVTLPGLRSIDLRAGWSSEEIRKAIEDLVA